MQEERKGLKQSVYLCERRCGDSSFLIAARKAPAAAVNEAGCDTGRPPAAGEHFPLPQLSRPASPPLHARYSWQSGGLGCDAAAPSCPPSPAGHTHNGQVFLARRKAQLPARQGQGCISVMHVPWLRDQPAPVPGARDTDMVAPEGLGEVALPAGQHIQLRSWVPAVKAAGLLRDSCGGGGVLLAVQTPPLPGMLQAGTIGQSPARHSE